MAEKDVVIIWISKEHGIGNLAHQQILNLTVTRPRKSLIICGANLTTYKVCTSDLTLTHKFVIFILFLNSESIGVEVITG